MTRSHASVLELVELPMREFPSPQEILKVFEREPGRTFRLRELLGELGLRSSQARELKNLLKGLARKKRISYLKKNTFALARGKDAVPESPSGSTSRGSRVPSPVKVRGGNVVSGRLISHRDGYGFVVPDAPVKGTDQDIFIPPDAMSSAMNGDRVEVQV